MSYKKNKIIIRKTRKISICEYYLGGGCTNNNTNINNNNKIHPDLVRLHEDKNKDKDKNNDWSKNKESSSKLPFIKEYNDDENEDDLEIHSIWEDSYYEKFLKYSCFRSSRVKNISY